MIEIKKGSFFNYGMLFTKSFMQHIDSKLLSTVVNMAENHYAWEDIYSHDKELQHERLKPWQYAMIQTSELERFQLDSFWGPFANYNANRLYFNFNSGIRT